MTSWFSDLFLSKTVLNLYRYVKVVSSIVYVFIFAREGAVKGNCELNKI